MTEPTPNATDRRPPADGWEWAGGILVYGYLGVLLALFGSLGFYLPGGEWWQGPGPGQLGHAVTLTLVTSVISTLLALLIAMPVAWRMSRRPVPGQMVIDVLIDLPMSLSPLVLGMTFLMFFATPVGRALEDAARACGIPIRGAPAGVVVGQTVIATAFAIRHLRGAFAASGTQDLSTVLIKQRPAVVVAATITWARTVGEFGPLLLFVGIIPDHTMVLSTAIYAAWSNGDLQGAAAAAALMVGLSFLVVLVVRRFAGKRN